PAEDAQRQDHAPTAALDRAGPGDHAGHVDAREPGHPRAARGKELIGRRQAMAPVFHLVAGAPDPVAPFSHAVEADGWVFVTGQMPFTGTSVDQPTPAGTAPHR